MQGFKVTEPDYTCKGFRYEIGQTYEMDEAPKLCDHGFHFCLKASDCFNFYAFNSDNHVLRVEALGDIAGDPEKDDKLCTNKIKILEEIPWEEVLRIVNEGKNCTGRCNTGNWNTGDCNTGNRNTGNCNTGNWNTGDCNTGNRNTGNWNTGDCNTGDCNTGNRNTGNWNTGNRNTGNWNTGDCNTGNRNTGNWNTGDWNTGNRNTGNWNTGDCNTGNWNTGDCNTGDCNTGNWNTGDCNTGNRNTGNWNTGNWNTGNWNTGDWNSCNYSSGCFNTKNEKAYFFNKSSDWTLNEWWNSIQRRMLNQIPRNVVEWVSDFEMTDEEKEQNPTYKTTGGYLKVLDKSDSAQLWWDGLTDEEKNLIRKLPNYDEAIFCEITGIKTEGGDADASV